MLDWRADPTTGEWSYTYVGCSFVHNTLLLILVSVDAVVALALLCSALWAMLGSMSRSRRAKPKIG